jgi:hypothetical protein
LARQRALAPCTISSRAKRLLGAGFFWGVFAHFRIHPGTAREGKPVHLKLSEKQQDGLEYLQDAKFVISTYQLVQSDVEGL